LYFGRAGGRWSVKRSSIREDGSAKYFEAKRLEKGLYSDEMLMDGGVGDLAFVLPSTYFPEYI